MRNILLFSVLLFSSCNDLFDWGATVGNCDKVCTVYHAARLEIIQKNNEINFSNFPRKEIYRNHVNGQDSDFKIESFYYLVSENNDSTFYPFSCRVYYCVDSVNYVVDSLIFK